MTAQALARRAAAVALVTLAAGSAPARAAAAVEAVLLDQGYSLGYGNAVTLNYAPYVLFADGTYTDDAEGALMPAPRVRGRWRRDGRNFVLEPIRGKPERIEADMLARPAARGRTIAGEYRSLSGVGNAAQNVPIVAAAMTLRFARDGSLLTTQAVGASTGSTATASRSGGSGRYELDGYTIRITGADGRVEQRLFYFFPDSERAIGVGGATLSMRR
jgi:hypothetical protein